MHVCIFKYVYYTHTHIYIYVYLDVPWHHHEIPQKSGNPPVIFSHRPQVLWDPTILRLCLPDRSTADLVPKPQRIVAASGDQLVGGLEPLRGGALSARRPWKWWGYEVQQAVREGLWQSIGENRNTMGIFSLNMGKFTKYSSLKGETRWLMCTLFWDKLTPTTKYPWSIFLWKGPSIADHFNGYRFKATEGLRGWFCQKSSLVSKQYAWLGTI